MWSHDISIHPKRPGYLIRVRITFSAAKNLDDLYKLLGEIRAALEKSIPGNIRPKYTVAMEGLLLMVNSKTRGEAARAQHQLDECIKAAIIKVKQG
ncbi:MAG: hypothetical protein ACN2B6_04560 [Rickettsiales bacterium]